MQSANNAIKSSESSDSVVVEMVVKTSHGTAPILSL